MPFGRDEAMYYAVNFKQNSLEMTDLGRDVITKSGEDPDFLLIPISRNETFRRSKNLYKQKAEVEKKVTCRRQP